MKKARFTKEQIIGVLRDHEAGAATSDVCRKHGISSTTFYKWKAQYGGLDVSETREPVPAGRHLAAGRPCDPRAGSPGHQEGTAPAMRLRQRPRVRRPGDAQLGAESSSRLALDRALPLRQAQGEGHSRMPSSRASMAACATSSRTRRCSRRSPRLASNSRNGGATATQNDRTMRSAI